jgi:hypothetical protein
MSEKYSRAFDLIAQLCIALNEHPLTKHAGCWVHQIDDHWAIAINGHEVPKEATLPGGATDSVPINVEPYHCYVEYNGWPAGIFNPFGGVIAAGEGANEGTFIKAIQAAIEQLGQPAVVGK